ncbi:MAG: phytoene desaturase family protein [Lentisphaeria bacterium]
MHNRQWDAIIVGAGHNGLTCAAFLARAGKHVLVLEARDRIGGACTLHEPWPGYRVSPCAYLCGLLHPLIIDELNLPAHGFEWLPAESGMFVPFDDGSSVQLWADEERCTEELRRFAPGDVDGFRAMYALMASVRDAIRPPGAEDLWIGLPPSRDELAARVGHDPDAMGLLFEWSMAEYVERYITDERLQCALLGQGIIGTNASPFMPGTASIHFHHACGRMFGQPGMWGYVKGGMGRVSFILADIARGAGVEIHTGMPVARINPGTGVELVDGKQINAPIIISNADPQVTLSLLGDAAPADWRTQVNAIPIEGCTVKVNVALHELPNFTARPGTDCVHHHGQINTPLTKAEWETGFDTAQAGRLPARLWTELYFHSARDSSIAPDGKHLMSIFAQYVPYTFADGDWDAHRTAAGHLAVDAVARFCSNLPDAIIDLEIMGPPDIEREVGLTGGHIFQGECLPPWMWDQRLSSRTPMPGVYLCGAATHPGGSVIGINGRNAATFVLQDT